VVVQVIFDGGDQFRYAPKDTASDTLVGDFTKPAFDQVQPGTGSWDEVQMESRMTPNPGFDSPMFVGPVIVHDQMQIESGRRFAINLLEETDELLMPVTRHTVADDFAIEHAQGGEQGGRAVALVIVRHRSAAPLLDRQPRLRPIEGLDLAFFVDTQDDGFVRWIEIEADDIGELFEKLLVSAELEGLDQMRLDVVLPPYSANRGLADPLCLGQGPSAPMSCSRRFGVQSGLNDCADLPFRNAWEAAGAWGIFLEPGHSQGEEALSPQLNGRSRDTQPPCDTLTRHSVSGHGDDSRALHNAQRQALRVRPCGQRRPLFGRQEYGWSEMHDT